MAPDVAEHLAIDGLDPGFLGDIAGFSGLDSRDVQDFAGIDRTTVSRRKASGSALPQGLGIGAWPLAQPANRCRIAAGDLLRRVARAGAT